MDFKIEHYDIEDRGKLTNEQVKFIGYFLRLIEKTEYDKLEYLECVAHATMDDILDGYSDDYWYDDEKNDQEIIYNVHFEDTKMFTAKLVYSTRQERNKEALLKALKKN